MPIVVQDYTWRETDNFLTIHVPLHGIHKSKVDLLTTATYIKASFQQFFFEIFPQHEIFPNQSKCTLNEKEIIYELEKGNPGKWEKLEKDLSKAEKKEIRRKARDEEEERLKAEEQERKTKKEVLKKKSVSEAVRIDTITRNQIDAIRNEEKMKALGDVDAWRKDVGNKVRKGYKGVTEVLIEPKGKPNEEKLANEKKSEKISHRNSLVPRKTKPKILNKKIINKAFDPTKSVPLPRSSQVIEVEFTKRVLPTPKRESQAVEETEWLKKQAEARRSVGFVSEDLRDEEKNPQYLLFKGNEFLKNSNYLGAISAYTFGIELSPKFVDLYVKRSEAQFKIGNYNKTMNDCSKALELMQPAVYANLSLRAICIGRRGCALHKMGMKRQAIDELRASLQLEGNPEFGKYLYMILDEKDEEVNEDKEETRENQNG